MVPGFSHEPSCSTSSVMSGSLPPLRGPYTRDSRSGVVTKAEFFIPSGPSILSWK